MLTSTLSLIGTLLAGFGGVFAVLTHVFEWDLSAEWATYRSWLVMIPVALVVLLGGPILIIPAIALLAWVGFREYAEAVGLTDRAAISIVGIAIALQAAAHMLFGTFSHADWLPFGIVVALFVSIILRNRPQQTLLTLSLTLVGYLLIGWSLSQLYALADSADYLLYLLLAVQVNDIAACNVGRVFGRTKLRSNISPNKTVAGAVGAIAVQLILGQLLLTGFPLWQRLLLGTVVSLASQLGDLSMSALKRDLGRKDMGDTIPGHGGVLDRIDSLLFAAPAFVLLLNLL